MPEQAAGSSTSLNTSSASSLDILADASQARRVATRRCSDGPGLSRKKPALTVCTAARGNRTLVTGTSDDTITTLGEAWAAKSEAMSPRQLEAIVKGIATEEINAKKVGLMPCHGKSCRLPVKA